MVDKESYLKDFQEFIIKFKNENDCWDYIFEIRWVNGFFCLKCKTNKYWLTEKSMSIIKLDRSG
jgi:hypothetical protein